MEAHQRGGKKKTNNKCNFVKQFQRSGIPCLPLFWQSLCVKSVAHMGLRVFQQKQLQGSVCFLFFLLFFNHINISTCGPGGEPIVSRSIASPCRHLPSPSYTNLKGKIDFTFTGTGLGENHTKVFCAGYLTESRAITAVRPKHIQ